MLVAVAGQIGTRGVTCCGRPDAGRGEVLFDLAADIGGVPRRPTRPQPRQHELHRRRDERALRDKHIAEDDALADRLSQALSSGPVEHDPADPN